MKSPPRQMLEQIAGLSRDGLAVLNVESAEWRIEWFNEAFASVTAKSAGALASQSGAQLIGRLAGEDVYAAICTAVSAAERAEHLVPGNVEASRTPLSICVQPLLRKDGTRSGRVLLQIAPQDAAGAEAQTATLRSELETAERRIRDMSDDPVTGLASAGRFSRQLDRDVALAQRESVGLSLICLTMEAYEPYVETFGQHATESCLRMLARTVRRRLRRGSDLAGYFEPASIVILMSGGGSGQGAGFCRFDRRGYSRVAHSPSQVATGETRYGPSCDRERYA